MQQKGTQDRRLGGGYYVQSLHRPYRGMHFHPFCVNSDREWLKPPQGAIATSMTLSPPVHKEARAPYPPPPSLPACSALLTRQS